MTDDLGKCDYCSAQIGFYGCPKHGIDCCYPDYEFDTEVAHLFAGMCMSHHLFTKSEIAYTCTLDEGHDGMHQSVGPAGEVFASWVHY